MILAFIDETSDANDAKYFGLCCAVVNSNFYGQIKNDFQKKLISSGWDPKIEFKGSCLFSASRGDTSMQVDKRVELAGDILSLNTSKVNARMKFAYLKKAESANQKLDYLTYLPALLKRILAKVSKKCGKNILSVQCDYRTDIRSEEVREAIAPVISERGYVLFEDVVLSKSGFNTVGLLYADIVGYLSSRVDTITNDSQLFENIAPEHWTTDGRLRKLRSSTTLLKRIKEFKRYQVVPK
ncbi:MAG: hypothetical protein A2234_00820 [Elusimicrobia bacterium RIFOXYA2_FULL_58_8]|nr:MAG: hypothetical protein A2285_06060 [Elusimicrobia bacterium RIFOXYA12_FULL_57_11]OGS12221.1 MAG: hypothetical protein A2234_00820 [Elusimicrobia bacterium RIFOXYA2_FULL_58_8]